MYLNTNEILNHISEEKLQEGLKKAPIFDIFKKEKGTITMRVKPLETDSDTANAVVAVIQRLNNAYFKAKEFNTEPMFDITNQLNEELYIGYETIVAYEGKTAVVTLAFEGAEGYLHTLVEAFGDRCARIHYENKKDETKTSDESNLKNKRPAIWIENTEPVKENDLKVNPIPGATGIPKSEKHENTKTQYKIESFRKVEDLVLYLNEKNIKKENIVDIWHRALSHTLIYAVED